MVKALALISGGLDSTLAAKLILNQGIEVEGLTIVTPFPGCEKYAAFAAKQLEIKHHVVFAGNDYIKIVKNPKYGHGTGMNPCVDCKIYFFKVAKKMMKKTRAFFIVTGEIVGQRPMSQMRKQIELIERKSGLNGLIVRPLCAKLFPLSIPEKKEIVDRNKLLDLSGRSRKIQIELAKKYKLKYASPSGGCILTDKNFSRKLIDLFSYKKRLSFDDIFLLKIGRHFRIGDVKIIVGRNEDENKILSKYKNKLEVIGFPGPITIIHGKKSKNIIEIAAGITARYSDAKALKKVKVRFDGKIINIKPATIEKIEEARI